MVKLRTGTAINPYAFTAKTTAQGLISAATGDLAVIRTQTCPRGRKAPIEYELHLNPAALGIAAVGAGLTLWLLQLRLERKDISLIVKKTIQIEAGVWSDPGYYIPDGWSLRKPQPSQPWYKEVSDAWWLIQTGLPILLPVKGLLDLATWVSTEDWELTEYKKHISATGHWETHTDIDYHQEFPREHIHTVWVEDSPAYDESFWRGHVTCYQLQSARVNDIVSRKGFSLAGPWP